MFRQGLRSSAVIARRVLPQATLALGRRQQLAAQPSRTCLPSIQAWKTAAQSSRMYSSETDAEAEPEKPADKSPAANDGMAVEFEQLHDAGVDRTLLRAITRDMGYAKMTPVQAKTINPALKGTDIVAQAKTGTGKTLAFLLPVMQRMLNEDPTLADRSAKRDARSDDIRGIVLSPTRELAEQIAEEARRLSRHTGIVVQSAVGGTQKSQMLRETRRRGCHLLVATPGRLHDLLSDPSSRIAAPDLAALVLDEADSMLDVGFERELNAIIDLLPNTKEKVRQTMLVSATIPDKVIRLTRGMVRPDDFQFVQTIGESETLTHDRIPQKVVPVTHVANLFPTLFELINKGMAECGDDPTRKPFKAIVYFNTTNMVRLAGELGFQKRRDDRGMISTFCIHSGLTQQGRTKAAERFRHSTSAILFSSDVTARGMDFPDVTHVIQVDCPRDRESYIHRLGRTGRQEKDGEGWLLLPQINRRNARDLLHDLPLNPDTSLECASVDPTSEEPQPEIMTTTNALYSKIDKEYLVSVYNTIFNSNKASRHALVEQMNEWVTKSWGWSAPPQVSRHFAIKCGLGDADLNFGESELGSERRSNSAGRFGSGDRQMARSSDPFDSMRSEIRTSGSEGGRRGFGGRGRSNGNSRHNGRGRRGQRDNSASSWLW